MISIIIQCELSSDPLEKNSVVIHRSTEVLFKVAQNLRFLEWPDII